MEEKKLVPDANMGLSDSRENIRVSPDTNMDVIDTSSDKNGKKDTEDASPPGRKNRRRPRVNFMMADWPENVTMTSPLFAQYASEMEKEDFEEEVRGLCVTIRLLVEARKETIEKLLAGADYLDSIWLRCRVSKTMGTSVSVVGGGLTIAGGILTTLTAGAAAPVLIAGIATSSVGAAANIGTSLVEKILNSKQIKEMNSAFSRDKEITNKFENQVEQIKRFSDSAHLTSLYYSTKEILGEKHLLMTILRGVLLFETLETATVSASLVPGGASTNTEMKPSSENSKTTIKASLFKQSSKDGVHFNPLDPGMLVEGGKVIGQNSFRVAGQVVIGVSAAFLVWDAIDLGFTISDLIRKQGSSAAHVLREKAVLLQEALDQTIGSYIIDMPD